MARKLVLLPMDLYKGLVSHKPEKKGVEDLTEEAPLQYEQAQLRKIKKRKGKNLSAKNVLYQQQLRRYLRTRKEAKDRPIKVQVGPEPQNVKLIKTSGPPGSLRSTTISDDGELEGVQEQHTSPGVRFAEGDEEVFHSPRTSRTSRTGSTSGSVSGSSRTLSTGTQSTLTAAPEPILKSLSASALYPKRKVKSNVEKEADVNTKVDELWDIIMARPQDFGVSKNGEIINPSTHRPVIQSNLPLALRKLVDPKGESGYSPIGMKFLRKALSQDQEAKKFLEEAHQQIGKGKRMILPKEHLFKPSKWRK
jgi:hypothetical protein